MNKIKKLLKSLLATSLFVVGLVCNPLNIKANDVEPAAAVTPYTREYAYVLDYSTVYIKLKFTPSAGYTRVTYQSATCEAFASNTSCSVGVISSGGYTDSDYNSRLVIKLRMTSGTKFENWQFTYFYDRLESKTKLSSN